MKKLILRVQELKEQNLFYAWIILKDGPAEQGLLHGTITEQNAKSLQELIGQCAIDPKAAFDGEFIGEPKPETRKEVQDTLFSEQSNAD